MCAIIGSFEKENILELVEKNQHRGRVAYSISLYDIKSSMVTSEYRLGEFDPEFLKSMNTDGSYIVCHLQSPTGVGYSDENKRHPSVVNRSYLWHNGILMPSTIKMLQEKYDDSTFDTHLLHQWLLSRGKLNEIEGSFACVFIAEHSMKIFRSKHSKLYIDDNMTISSESFLESKCINADRIYMMDLEKRSLAIESYFKTKRYNIIIKGELDD